MPLSSMVNKYWLIGYSRETGEIQIELFWNGVLLGYPIASQGSFLNCFWNYFLLHLRRLWISYARLLVCAIVNALLFLSICYEDATAVNT